MNPRELKKADKQLTRGLLDIIVLELLRKESMHGYKVITTIRKNFGAYFGPSTIYPFLAELQEKGYITSKWDTNHDRPRKVFSITAEGKNLLTGIEQSFSFICSRLNSMGLQRLPTITAPNNTISNQIRLQ
ncbi:MAG: PadR family transcriptional regulator [Candidatus Bathyarchaeota archaeon]